jgi:glycosyltransferase involved in cell wall biosynthesis
VVVGTIEARKNHLMLLNVWRRLVDRLGADAPGLLIVGQRGWEAEEVFRVLDRPGSLEGHVIEFNRCSDEELAAHLASARALLFPSLVEGYGLPLVEALAFGVPAIASDLTVFREIAGDIPNYLSPHDTVGWENAILDYARPDSESRTAQLKRLQGFTGPSWYSHFAKVEAWLASLG